MNNKWIFKLWENSQKENNNHKNWSNKNYSSYFSRTKKKEGEWTDRQVLFFAYNNNENERIYVYKTGEQLSHRVTLCSCETWFIRELNLDRSASGLQSLVLPLISLYILIFSDIRDSRERDRERGKSLKLV